MSDPGRSIGTESKVGLEASTLHVCTYALIKDSRIWQLTVAAFSLGMTREFWFPVFGVYRCHFIRDVAVLVMAGRGFGIYLVVG